MKISSKFRGKCRECGGQYEVGDQVEWERGKGTTCMACVEGTSKPEPMTDQYIRGLAVAIETGDPKAFSSVRRIVKERTGREPMLEPEMDLDTAIAVIQETVEAAEGNKVLAAQQTPQDPADWAGAPEPDEEPDLTLAAEESFVPQPSPVDVDKMVKDCEEWKTEQEKKKGEAKGSKPMGEDDLFDDLMANW